MNSVSLIPFIWREEIDGLITVVGQQILLQLVSLILKDLTHISGHFPRDLLHIDIQFAQIIRQTDQLIQCANLYQHNQ